MIRLVATDLDDTLLSHDLSISAQNKEMIASAMERGVTVTIATGRMYVSALPFAKQLELPPETPLICYNGALIKRVSGETLYEAPLGNDLAMQIAQFCTDQGWVAEVFYDDQLYVSQINDAVRRYERIAGISANEVGDIVSFINEGKKRLSKILVIRPEDEADASTKELQRRFGDQAQVVRSRKQYIEITNLDAHKGKALMWVADFLGIKQSEVMAVGDSSNDVSMLKTAGIGVAVANAADSVKNVANYVTSSNGESGLGKAIQEHVLSL